MSEPISVHLGQFSGSPVIAAAEHLGLDAQYGLKLTTSRVMSSPAQFQSLNTGEIDVAITSPDNVLLYGTTAKNPLETELPIRMIRAIDRGLGLALFTTADFTETSDIPGSAIAVDVVKSGFALLLFTMLADLGISRDQVDFPELGATPKRLTAVLAGEADGTILNAESRIGAQEAGLKQWRTSRDISAHYLGTVLAVRRTFDPDTEQRLVGLWNETTTWLLTAPDTDVRTALQNAGLGSAAYLELLRNPDFGLLDDPAVQREDLDELCRIRQAAGAYSPDSDALERLLS
ncbi:MAG: hypothetical protein RJB01_1721 [Actinomycetota bacterium]